VDIVDGRYVKQPGRKEENWVWSPQGVVDMHRPETWGYVQFSAASAGTDAFRRDPAELVRMTLMEVYYAQKAFHEANGRWAVSLADLECPTDQTGVTMQITPDGWVASAVFAAPGHEERWNVRQDSRLWSD
jgi:hypothetical protein